MGYGKKRINKRIRIHNIGEVWTHREPQFRNRLLLLSITIHKYQYILTNLYARDAMNISYFNLLASHFFSVRNTHTHTIVILSSINNGLSFYIDWPY